VNISFSPAAIDQHFAMYDDDDPDEEAEATEAARFWSGLDAEQRIDAARTVQGFFENTDLVWEIFRDSVVSGVRTYYREQVDPA
jgi:hypothetical protein